MRPRSRSSVCRQISAGSMRSAVHALVYSRPESLNSRIIRKSSGDWTKRRRSSGARHTEIEWPPQKLPARSETRRIATNLKSGDQNNKTSVDDEILPALAVRLGRFVSLLGSQFTI